MLLKTVVSGKLQPEQLITHHFTLDQLMQAYNTFGNAMKEEALKVIIKNDTLLSEVMQVSSSVGNAEWREGRSKKNSPPMKASASKNEKPICS